MIPPLVPDVNITCEVDYIFKSSAVFNVIWAPKLVLL